ncbi:hypothetical protein [Niabella sp.]|uniref:hypothetical protein n=1 Tax=Niabella sp. TaxID=1962976 RepID=UPI002601F5B4|nr:hypothetical protein [Niabella sp.]
MTYRNLIDFNTKEKDVELQKVVNHINEFYNNKGCHVDTPFVKEFRDALVNYYYWLDRQKKCLSLMGGKHPDDEITDEDLQKILQNRI